MKISAGMTLAGTVLMSWGLVGVAVAEAASVKGSGTFATEVPAKISFKASGNHLSAKGWIKERMPYKRGHDPEHIGPFEVLNGAVDCLRAEASRGVMTGRVTKIKKPWREYRYFRMFVNDGAWHDRGFPDALTTQLGFQPFSCHLHEFYAPSILLSGRGIVVKPDLP